MVKAKRICYITHSLCQCLHSEAQFNLHICFQQGDYKFNKTAKPQNPVPCQFNLLKYFQQIINCKIHDQLLVAYSSFQLNWKKIILLLLIVNTPPVTDFGSTLRRSRSEIFVAKSFLSFILSPQYLQSYFCRFPFHLCQTYSFIFISSTVHLLSVSLKTFSNTVSGLYHTAACFNWHSFLMNSQHLGILLLSIH